MSDPTPDTTGLTVLGGEVRHAIDHVECFPAPADVTVVRFETDELSSICPVTSQPDISHLLLEYGPNQHCIESKSLKLYLWGFRDRPVFAEALAAEIAREVMAQAMPLWVRTTVRQQPRGGIILEAVSEMGSR
jgi:7-cyano-7-deazaguanine reductase